MKGAVESEGSQLDSRNIGES